MTTTAVQDEVTSINAIYGNDTLSQFAVDPTLYTIRFPPRPLITLRLKFPEDYPDAPPAVLGTESSANEGSRKGEGRRLAGLVTEVLHKVYQAGQPCIFDLIEEISEQLGREQGVNEQDNALRSDPDDMERVHAAEPAGNNDGERQHDAPGWVLSSVITEKKSVFTARAAAVSSPAQARLFLAHLMITDKKVAKATHIITAWRIRCPDNAEISYQDCDDDGETAAGGRVLHLMQLTDVWGVMVVVTRWYGGVQLGPDRFRIITQTARDALVRGGFIKDGPKEHSRNKKREGKK